jgi:Phosphate starvation-inducible protein PhoH, predicted ATPase
MPNMRKSVHSLDIEFNDNNILSSLFGINDVNIHTLEKINNVKIEYRGNKVKILGSKKSIATTKNELINLFEEAKKGIEIDEEKIKDTKSILKFSLDSEIKMDLFIETKKRKIIPRSENQKKYFELLNNKDIVLAIGPAGTGKTFIAVAKAVSLLQEKKDQKNNSI